MGKTRDKKQRCVVVGGEGFVGGRVATHLRKLGHEVVILDDYRGWHQDWDDELHEADVVFYMPAEMGFHTNIASYQNTLVESGGFLERIGRVKNPPRLILASSEAIYGGAMGVRELDFGTSSPSSYYGLSKRQQENLFRMASANMNFNATFLRYAIVLGSKQKGRSECQGILKSFARAVSRGEAPILFEDGEQTRDYVHVEDAGYLTALIGLEENYHGVRTFNIANPKALTVNKVWEYCAEFYEKKGVEVLDPIYPGYTRLGDPRHVSSDSSKISRQYPTFMWRPIREAIHEYLEWHYVNVMPKEQIEGGMDNEQIVQSLAKVGSIVLWEKSE